MSLKIIVLFAASLVTCSLGFYNTRECPNARYRVELSESVIICKGGPEDLCVISPDAKHQVVAARFMGKYPDEYGGFTTVKFILTGDSFNITKVTQELGHTWAGDGERSWKFDFIATTEITENFPPGEKGTIRAIADYGSMDDGFCLEMDLEIKNKD